ncbi:TetR/AcrR family transcriptional regulator [Reyranella sp. CPCC 100927]|uniref:TetR/AcrR family transcriptional regulator n=1 Tax=Reyranella sp. CPCC 100927 TaxID=2599616 RepID=UPI0011B5ABD4|nr:TetR/AcrR family transcriptional regulator [Reyranella sp. CPCC 100927]TWT03148.1 TetR/AcrR family transcriptional regulator [Reyranella sp. CPCC 100927]
MSDDATHDRLTRADWIRHGLRTLAIDGPGALKVGPMAAALDVSRGSFYWHFQDIADFRGQLLQSWRQTTTDQIIQDLDAHEGEPGRLLRLMRRAFKGRRRLDLAVRAWAAHDAAVAAAVASVDKRRIAHLARLLVDAGVGRAQANHRAAFLYWAYLGQAAVMDRNTAAMPAEALADLARLFET